MLALFLSLLLPHRYVYYPLGISLYWISPSPPTFPPDRIERERESQTEERESSSFIPLCPTRPVPVDSVPCTISGSVFLPLDSQYPCPIALQLHSAPSLKLQSLKQRAKDFRSLFSIVNLLHPKRCSFLHLFLSPVINQLHSAS